jgi:hypothetical protein
MDDDTKTRKKWLISFFLFTTLQIFILFLNLAGDEFQKNPHADLMRTLFIQLFYAFGLNAFKFLFTYALVYRNRFKWILIGILVVLPLNELKELMFLDFKSFNTLTCCMLALHLSIEINYWFNTLRLYRLYALPKKPVVLET